MKTPGGAPRGTRYFADKVRYAASAGAIAAVVYDHIEGGTAIVMGGLSTATIPAVMISNTDGTVLQAFITANPAAAAVKADAGLQPVAKASTAGVREARHSHVDLSA